MSREKAASGFLRGEALVGQRGPVQQTSPSERRRRDRGATILSRRKGETATRRKKKSRVYMLQLSFVGTRPGKRREKTRVTPGEWSWWFGTNRGGLHGKKKKCALPADRIIGSSAVTARAQLWVIPGDRTVPYFGRNPEKITLYMGGQLPIAFADSRERVTKKMAVRKNARR